MAKERRHNRTMAKSRKRAFRDPKERFLIFCEGQFTEVEYFKAFKLVTADIKAKNINEGDAWAFVRNAIRQKDLYLGYDQYWLVFDKDNTPNENYNKAIRDGKKIGFQIAYSNRAFEYWYLLHFTKTKNKMNSSSLDNRLTQYLGFRYRHNQEVSKRMFDILLPKQEKAIKNAKAIYNSFKPHSNTALEESSTTVFKLVEELNKYIK